MTMSMKKFLKWAGLIIGGLLGLVVLTVGVIFIIIGRGLSETHTRSGVDLEVPTAVADIAEGERLTRILGCNGGCHGKDGSNGGIFFEVPDGTTVVAPDLHRLAGEYTTAQLELAIRHGIKSNGKTVVAIMPSAMFYNLTDRQTGQLIAYLRSQPPGEETLPTTWMGPMARAMLFYFRHKEGWEIFAAREIDHDLPRLPYDPGDPVVHGRYLAMTSCTECHGKDLKGSEDGSMPDLVIAAAYSQDQFFHLMKTGEPIGNRELDLMARVAQSRFAYFTADEVESLYAYLQSRALAKK